MIKHIVFWRFSEIAYGNDKQTNAQILKEKLLAMQGKVDGLLKVEVGFDFSNEKDSSDVVLYSEFESKEALHQYQIHPDHEDIKKWLSEVRYERRVVDYEIS
ncbi:MAG: Dabb family protein [Ignavibacteria bacterium]|nr:Dabb family protein [Ignavibacteria bacterium]